MKTILFFLGGGDVYVSRVVAIICVAALIISLAVIVVVTARDGWRNR